MSAVAPIRTESLPEDWQQASLGDICSLIKRGVAPKYTEQGGIPVVNQKCIRHHEIDLALARRHDLDKKRVPDERFIQIGDVLVNSTGTGTLGRVAQVRNAPAEPTTVDTHVTIVRPDADKFYLPFFGYALITIEQQLIAAGQGAVGQTELPRSDLSEKFDIAFPSDLDEQKRIVAVLDQAFAALDRVRSITEQNISDIEELRARTAKQLVTSMMQGVSKEKLGDLAEFRNGLNFSRHSQGETVKVAGVGDFQNNFLLPVQQLKTTMIEGSLRNDDKLREGDIISVRSNGNKALIGRVMLVGETEPDVSFSGFVIRIRRTSEKLSSEFLCRFMKSADAVSHLIAGGGGAQISNLNQRILSQLEVPLPSPETQDNFANAMARLDDSCRELTARYKNKIAQLSVIRESLLYSAFAGQLT